MISSEAISVFIGMLPEMNTTEPYSPSARANDRAKPVSSAGSTAGRITRQNVCQRRRAQAGGRFFRFAVDFFDRRLQRAHDERQADERQARSVIPSGENAALMPSGSRILADPAVLCSTRP